MSRHTTGAILALCISALLPAVATAQSRAPANWKVHDTARPRPRVVSPGAPLGRPVPAPSDAIVLIGPGLGLREWRTDDSAATPARWTVRGDAIEVKPGTGSIRTVRAFGDVQLHVEWAAPTPAVGKDQERGNSGVYLMSTYELQVLDSYRNDTYPDGQAASIFGQYPPLVNASRPAGQWQTYDIVFHAPRFAADGRLLQPARMTVLHNGVLVQDNETLTGPTAFQARPPYSAHAGKLPIVLQDHEHRVRYRNIWVREI